MLERVSRRLSVRLTQIPNRPSTISGNIDLFKPLNRISYTIPIPNILLPNYCHAMPGPDLTNLSLLRRHTVFAILIPTHPLLFVKGIIALESHTFLLLLFSRGYFAFFCTGV